MHPPVLQSLDEDDLRLLRHAVRTALAYHEEMMVSTGI